MIRPPEILQMRLQRLTGLEQEKITGEYREVMVQIVDLLDVLAKPARITTIIADELDQIRNDFGDERRSEIVLNALDVNDEDLITPQDMVVTLSHAGYMKSQPLDEYRAQKRGGRGKQATTTKEDDWIDQLFIANTHDMILAFSDRGRVYWLKVYEVPQGSRGSRGRPLVNMWPLADGEKVTVVLAVTGGFDDRDTMCSWPRRTAPSRRRRSPTSPTAHGRHHRGRSRRRRSPHRRGAHRRQVRRDAVLRLGQGGALRRGRRAPHGPRRARRARHESRSTVSSVIALLVRRRTRPTRERDIKLNSQSVLTATENGYGKRTPIAEYTPPRPRNQGHDRDLHIERNGKVVAATLVDVKDEIMLITTGGVLIRTRVSEIARWVVPHRA